MWRATSFHRVMFKVFLTISVLGAALLLGINDIESGAVSNYIIYASCVFASVFITILFYNYRLVGRFIFATRCLFNLIYGSAHGLRSKKYDFLYDAALKTNSISRFYKSMLRLYDVANKHVVTVSDYYRNGD